MRWFLRPATRGSGQFFGLLRSAQRIRWIQTIEEVGYLQYLSSLGANAMLTVPHPMLVRVYIVLWIQAPAQISRALNTGKFPVSCDIHFWVQSHIASLSTVA